MRVDGSRIVETIKSDNSMDNMKETVNVNTGTKLEDTDKISEPRGILRTSVEKTFKETKLAAEDVMAAAQNLENNKVNANLNYIADTMTTSEVDELTKIGYSPEDTDVETMVSVIEKIRIKMAAGGADINLFGINVEDIKEVTGNEVLSKKIMSAMEKSKSLKSLSEREKKYIVENGLEPTIENIYKTEFSINQGKEKIESLDEEVWKDLVPQVERMMQEAGLEKTELRFNNARWLVERGISLTKETLIAKESLDELIFPLEQESVLEGIKMALVEGKEPSDAKLTQEANIIDRAKEAIEIIKNTSDEDIKGVISSGKELTLINLKEFRGRENKSAIEESEGRFITAKRQVAELSLKLTIESGVGMLKRGIEIETKNLADLVEELRLQEEEYYGNLFKTEGLIPSRENIELFVETVETSETIKAIPEYILGRSPFRSIGSEEVLNIKAIAEKGGHLKSELDSAGEKYETLMTSPRADMGDSIKKAFRNIDTILEDLGYEITEENRKAIRVLSYNQMEINDDNIAMIKESDQKVTNLVNGLKPSVVMKLIKENINPLEMNIDELNQIINKISTDEDFLSIEKYSEFLWKLEHSEGISSQERESYIGIYRLVRNIEKTDSAALGALINQNAELTLKNILTAMRSDRKRGMNYTVDDAFGHIERSNGNVKDIMEQIESAFKDVNPNEMLQKIEAMENNKELLRKYQEELIKEMQNTSYNDEYVSKLLVENDIPAKYYNIQAAGNVLNKRNTWFKRILDGKTAEIQDIKQQILERFAESVKTPQEMAEAMETLGDIAENVMENMVEDTSGEALNIKEIQMLHKELSIMKKMSEHESYTIPVQVGDSLTGVTLKIIRGENDKGKVNVVFDDDVFGKVGAEIRIKDDAISTLIVAKSNETLEIMKESKGLLERHMGTEYADIDTRYVFATELDINKFSTMSGRNQPETEGENSVQTKKLYEAAKAFLTYVNEAFNRYSN